MLRALAVISVSGSLLVAGCGGGSSSSADNAFKQAYQSQRTQLNAISAQLGTIIQGASGKTDAQLAAELTALDTSLRAQLNQLDALKPPSKYQADFNAVVSDSNQAESGLKALAAAVAAHNANEARTLVSTLNTDGQTLKAASAKLVKELGLKPSQ